MGVDGDCQALGVVCLVWLFHQELHGLIIFNYPTHGRSHASLGTESRTRSHASLDRHPPRVDRTGWKKGGASLAPRGPAAETAARDHQLQAVTKAVSATWWGTPPHPSDHGPRFGARVPGIPIHGD